MRRVRGWSLWLVACAGFAQQVAEAPSDAGGRLLDLMNTPITVSSHIPLPNRESPGITTVLQREEILASGARDLVDLLRMVPGFAIASDTNGVMGIGVRTCWGHDGKVLVLVDGQEMNEPLYGTTQFGGHYPIDNAQRIEIIRGPGSAIYGGYAELAVINIITRKGGSIGGVDGAFWAGRMAGTTHDLAQGYVAFGRTYGDLDLALSYSRGQLPMNVGPWQNSPNAGSTLIEGGDFSSFHQDFLSLKASYQNLNVSVLRDDYAIHDFTGEFKQVPTPIHFPGTFFAANYLIEAGDWSFKPTLSIKSQLPWLYTEWRTDRNTRTVGGILATWAAGRGFKAAFGGEAIQDNTSIFWSSRGVRERYIYESRAAYLQLLWTHPYGNLDLGLRYDDNSAFGSATSPRLAYTRATESWHIKLLAAGAFRSPSYENLFANPNLEPERTTTYEVEGGHTLGASTYLTANLFFLRVEKPISYGNLSPGVNGYFNFDHTGARGLELTTRSLWTDLMVQTSLSLSRADDQAATFYQVEGEPDFHVGFANLKATAQAQWQVRPGWSLTLGVVHQGRRYGYRYGDLLPSSFGATTLVNLFLTRRFSDHLEVGLSGTNLGNVEDPFIQAYGIPGVGGNPPLPGPGRQLALRVAWAF